MNTGENLADLANLVETTDSVDVPTIDTSAEIDLEACAMLGAAVAKSGRLVPEPYSAALCLLEMVESPFLTGEQATMQDLFACLYILHRGEEALRPIYAAVRTRRALEKAAGKAWGSGDEASHNWVAHVHLTSMALGEFDRKAMAFGRGLGVIDISKTVADVRAALHTALGGLRMFPGSEGRAETAAHPLGQNGWRGWLSRRARSLTGLRTRFGGASRSQPSGTSSRSRPAKTA